MGTRIVKLLSPILGVVLLISLTAGSSVSLASQSSQPAAASQSSQPTAASRPARQIALGVSMLPYDDLSMLDSFTDSVAGHVPAVWSVWSDWGGTNAAFPTTLMNGLRDRGVTPLVFWQPVHTGDLTDSTFTYQKIANGVFDDYITTWAQAAKDWGGAVIVRFAHEMDGDWFPWSVARPPNTPALFSQAWRHIWNIFRGPNGVGANNVRFLWSPYAPQASYRSWYPGDRYVDYVGFTGLNWGTYGTHQWQSMQETFHEPLAQLWQITHKPVIVAEAGSNVAGGNKAAWIQNGYPAVYNDPHAGAIAAIVYFDVNVGGQVNWLLTNPAGNPPPALAAYADVVADARFQGRMTHPVATLKLPAATRNATVPVTLSATDAWGTGIAAYYLSESPTPPALSDSGWLGVKPSTFNLSAGEGSKTVYAWVKDRNGTLSPRASAVTRLDTTTPIVQTPTVQFAANARAHGATNLIVSWSPASGGAPIARYKLQGLVGNKHHRVWKNIRLASRRAKSVRVSVKAGRRYTYRVRAVDTAGRWSSWAETSPVRVTVRQDGSSGVRYSGHFTKGSESKAMDGHVHFSSTAGRTASFAFRGGSVAFVTSIGPDHGQATVWLDGTQVASLDLYAKRRAGAWIAFATDVPYGQHTLQIRVSGTGNRKSSGKRVDIDAFMVLN